jgi:demethylmenaquinone methyltransferase/2-methoxy-6-polyprenyl-1,4-benzoquinol methylase
MAPERRDADSSRFAPRAQRQMAEMFDDVSGRYDLLNRLMSLGRDGAWREAMWRGVPEPAGVVLDLCTGSGVSLAGLRRPGRLVVGADVSLQMLELAATRHTGSGWAPRLVCADAFALPFGDASLDAITVAFGVRNLRPRAEGLAELARVLKTDGVLSVLEAVAPAGGPLAPLHRFYLTRLVPAAGHLSDDPSAYRYLGQSILEFGSGPEFEADLERTGFRIEARRSFALGAARLWVARRRRRGGQIASDPPAPLQIASPGRAHTHPGSVLDSEWRIWTAFQALVSGALTVALLYAAAVLGNLGGDLPLRAWERRLGWILIIGGVLGFGWRTIVLAARWRGGRPRS